MYITDINDRALENATFNVKTNSAKAENADLNEAESNALNATAEIQPIEAGSSSTSVRVLRLNWFDETTYPIEKIHVILGSDLVYESRILPPLMKAIQLLIAEDGYFLYVAPDENREGMSDLILSLEGIGMHLQQQMPCPSE